MPEEPRSGGELARLTPEVRTLAKPQAVPLIGARGVVHRSPTIKALFQQAKAESWTPEQLAGAITPELEQALDCEPEAAVEVAQYLADEFFQLGDSVLVCDRTTGKAIARISDADMYQPPPVRREHGGLATPLPRLNPNLEGFLVSYIFEQERDQRIRAEILAKLPGTQFLTADLDPRPRPATRAGRLVIAQDVRDALPDILQGVQGAARTFLGCFVHAETPPPSLTTLPRRTAVASSRQNIVDPKAMNLRFSWEATIKARTGAGWVREMAAHLVTEARRQIRPDLQLTVALPLLTADHLEGITFWAGDAATCIAIRRTYARDQEVPPFFPCENAPGVVGWSMVTGPVGAVIVHPEGYEFSTREAHLRWEMTARMEYTLCVDWDRVRFLRVTDIPVEATAEIFR